MRERGTEPRWCRGHHGRRQSGGVWGDVEGRLMPSPLPGLGTPSPWVIGVELPSLLATSGACASERSLLAVVVGWDGPEGAARCREAELSACCSRATWRSHLASCSRSLAFGLACQRCPPASTGDDRHVVVRLGEAQGAGCPRAGVVVVDGRLCGLLLRKVLPLALSSASVASRSTCRM
jgi:hypothetical protein